MVLDFKVERLFVEKQVTFLFLPFSAARRTDGTTSPPQRKKQTKTSHAIHTILKNELPPQKKTHNLIASIAKASA